MRKIERLIIHHSASACGTVEQIRKEHMARGYSDIGYHWLIGNGCGIDDGQIVPGRPEAKVGAAVFKHNAGNLYCCLIGQFARAAPGYTGPPTPRQWAALGHWLWVKGRAFSVPPERVLGHDEWAIPGHHTQCPGDLPLAAIRRWYAAARHHEVETDVSPLAL